MGVKTRSKTAEALSPAAQQSRDQAKVEARQQLDERLAAAHAAHAEKQAAKVAAQAAATAAEVREVELQQKAGVGSRHKYLSLGEEEQAAWRKARSDFVHVAKKELDKSRGLIEQAKADIKASAATEKVQEVQRKELEVRGAALEDAEKTLALFEGAAETLAEAGLRRAAFCTRAP